METRASWAIGWRVYPFQGVKSIQSAATATADRAGVGGGAGMIYAYLRDS